MVLSTSGGIGLFFKSQDGMALRASPVSLATSFSSLEDKSEQVCGAMVQRRAEAFSRHFFQFYSGKREGKENQEHFCHTLVNQLRLGL